MAMRSREAIFEDLLEIMNGLTEWEYSEPITFETGFFADLGFESIDAVALGAAIEEHYQRRLPFAEFLADAREREAPDITVGELVEFLHGTLNGSETGASESRAGGRHD